MFTKLRDRALRTSARTYGAIVTAILGGALIVWAVVNEHVVALVSLTVLAAIGYVVAKRVAKTRRIRMAKIEAAYGRTDWPERFGRWIHEDESAELEGRQHPIVMLRWWALAFGGLVAAVVALFVVQSWVVSLILLVVPLCISGWKTLMWWYDWWVISNIRVVKIVGILSEEAPAAQLAQILTAKPVIPFFSRWVLMPLGVTHYGHIILETAAQVEAIKALYYVPNPEVVNEKLQSHFSDRTEDQVQELLLEFLKIHGRQPAV